MSEKCNHEWTYKGSDELQYEGHYGAMGYAYCRKCGLKRYDNGEYE